MQLNDYVEQVGEQLRAAAALGDDRTQQIADALAGTASSAVRLAILSAASAVCAEISAALFDVEGAAGTGVSVHLDGDELRIAVTPPAGASSVPASDDSDSTARISLRLSEALKAFVEEAAGREGLSINAWLVRSIAATARGGGRQTKTAWPSSGGKGGHHITGWVTG
jgi:hypothetical protein